MIQEIIEDAILKASKIYEAELKNQLQIQGHRNTGKLENSIEYSVQVFDSMVKSVFSMNDYGIILDPGVKPNRIPFKRGSGAKTSKYIDGLIKYFRSKGHSEKKSKAFAFATATIQKREGMPTKASSRFSSNGKRTGFIDDTYLNTIGEINFILYEQTVNQIVLDIEQTFLAILKRA